MIIKRIDKQPKHKQALLFFAGWGMDEHPFLPFCNQDIDYIMAFDYRTLHFDETVFRSYESIEVVAWSMGVWAASVVLSDTNLPVAGKIAVNGTLTPIDDRKGIPPAIFDGTLNGLNEHTLGKFLRRCCGNATAYEQFLQHRPQRSLEEVTEELRQIRQQVHALPPAKLCWDKAYIGTQDKIFSKDNQLRAWQGTPCTLLEEEHYSEKIWQTLL